MRLRVKLMMKVCLMSDICRPYMYFSLIAHFVQGLQLH